MDEQLFALPDEMTKVCTVCKEARPLGEFATRPGATRKQSWCRTCKQAYDRDWYQRNKEQHKANVAVISRRRRAALSALIVQAKARPSADCGRTYPHYVMDFDHVRGTKLANVSEMRNGTVKAMQAEIEKCEVVCANCHRIRSYGNEEDREVSS